MRAGEGDRQAIRTRIAGVARPATDPVAGADGPMLTLWR
jgi:uncharacterized protein YjlB